MRWFDLPLRSANLAFERRLIILASARTSIAGSDAGSRSFRSPLTLLGKKKATKLLVA
jgi:hypothetical protein